MRLRNKKTGEIPDKIETIAYIQWSKKIMMVYINSDGVRTMKHYDSLNDFNEEWEDYEEPKEYWFIDFNGEIKEFELIGFEWQGWMKEIGNYFDTLEEAQKAVEKLKAWKRLKDKGFKFEGIKEDFTRILQSQEPFRTGKRYLQFNKSEDEEWMKENWKDLDLLFGGEE